MAGAMEVSPGGTSWGPFQPMSTLRLAHQDRWYSSPNAAILSLPVVTSRRQICRFPPFGALAAAATTRRRCSTGIGSGRILRIDRCVNIASPTGIGSSLASASRFTAAAGSLMAGPAGVRG